MLINIDALEERGDIYSDDNGAWIQKACKTNYFTTQKTDSNRVTGLTKVSQEEQGDITVRRRSYVCKSCPTFHKLMVTIEYGREIEMWYPVVFLQYKYDGEEKAFEVSAHGNRKTESSKPYVRTKQSTNLKASENLKGLLDRREHYLQLFSRLEKYSVQKTLGHCQEMKGK